MLMVLLLVVLTVALSHWLVEAQQFPLFPLTGVLVDSSTSQLSHWLGEAQQFPLFPLTE